MKFGILSVSDGTYYNSGEDNTSLFNKCLHIGDLISLPKKMDNIFLVLSHGFMYCFNRRIKVDHNGCGFSTKFTNSLFIDFRVINFGYEC